jgi:hypothetical protein
LDVRVHIRTERRTHERNGGSGAQLARQALIAGEVLGGLAMLVLCMPVMVVCVHHVGLHRLPLAKRHGNGGHPLHR